MPHRTRPSSQVRHSNINPCTLLSYYVYIYLFIYYPSGLTLGAPPPVMRPMTFRALLLLILLSPGAATPQDDPPESAAPPDAPPVTLVATNWLGEAVAGARFHAVTENATTEPQSLASDAEGRVLLPRVAGESLVVRLADDRYITDETEQTAMASDQLQLWRLFSSDVSALPLAERRELARFWPRIVAQRPWAEPASLPAPQTAERIVRFVPPYRTEAEEAIALEGSPFAGDGTFAFRVYDDTGRPAQSVLARLYVLDEANGTIQPIGFERTDAAGRVTFEGLSRGHFFRAEVSGAANTRATTTVAQPGESGASAGDVVLRPENEAVRGFVVHAGKPAADAIVRTQMVPGARALTTSTDASGFFSLGPVNSATVPIVLTLNTERGATGGRWNARAGREEFIDLDLIAE